MFEKKLNNALIDMEDSSIY